MNTVKEYTFNGVHIKVTPQKEKMPEMIRPMPKISAAVFFISLLILGVRFDLGYEASPLLIVAMAVSGISILTKVYKDQIAYIIRKIRHGK